MGFEVSNVVVDPREKPIYPYDPSGEDAHDRYITSPYVSKLRYGRDLTVEFLRHVLSHDIFVFTASGSFFGNFQYTPGVRRFAYIDLPILKLLGKRVVVIVTGSKMRSDALLLEDMRQNDAVSADHVRTLEA
jgi:hypothetical protein